MARLRVYIIISLATIVLPQFVLANKSIVRTPQAFEDKVLTEQWSPPEFSVQDFLGYQSDTFSVPEGMQKEVDFWIRVYSQYTTKQGIFHYKNDLENILGEIDLTQIYSRQDWSAVRRELEAELVVKRQKRILAKRLKVNPNKIRLQMGLKDRMLKAIELSGRYLPLMERVFKEENIPLELTRVVFVESSFNIRAGSKVGASGLWQIMPIIAKKSKYIHQAYDLRQDPYYSTKLAAHILRQNFQILQSWPMAVTAYNHGVGSLGKIIKKYKSNDISYLIKNVESKKSFGFASRNFYATFLAALYVESHANLYFPEPILKEAEMKFKDIRLKKSVKYEELLLAFDNDKEKLKQYNPQLNFSFLKSKRRFPKGTVINFPQDTKSPLAELTEDSTKDI